MGLGSWLLGDGEAHGVSERAPRVVRAVTEAHEGINERIVKVASEMVSSYSSEVKGP